MAAAAVDTAYLANTFAIPEPTIHSLIDAPTAQLVQSFLQQLASKARDYDTSRAERLRLDVELENAVRLGESRARSLKTGLEKATRSNEDLTERLKAEGYCSAAKTRWIAKH